MKTFLVLTALAAVALAQEGEDYEFAGPQISNFRCPEDNGLFPDPEQCDLYYECIDGVSNPKLCPDGEVFDISKPNRERCILPYNVDCGARQYVQEPRLDVDPGCKRANGFFPHLDENVCEKFYQCNDGHKHEMQCAPPLIFDEGIGSCARAENASPEARICNNPDEVKSVEGVTCDPTAKVFTAGLRTEHPSYPHPTDCQLFITCFGGRNPVKLGCSKGNVFDAERSLCKTPEEVPECACWYECGENSQCPDSCNADCSCPEK